jgi:hypothetical protein
VHFDRFSIFPQLLELCVFYKIRGLLSSKISHLAKINTQAPATPCAESKQTVGFSGESCENRHFSATEAARGTVTFSTNKTIVRLYGAIDSHQMKDFARKARKKPDSTPNRHAGPRLTEYSNTRTGPSGRKDQDRPLFGRDRQGPEQDEHID